LPIYAKDILQVGPVGFRLAAGSSSYWSCMYWSGACTSTAFQKGWQKPCFWLVIGFGIATVVFGLSRSFWLSLLMLFLLGGLDNISVVIRTALLLMRTPDEMRGRVCCCEWTLSWSF